MKVSWVSACTFRYLHCVVHTFKIMYADCVGYTGLIFTLNIYSHVQYDACIHIGDIMVGTFTFFVWHIHWLILVWDVTLWHIFKMDYLHVFDDIHYVCMFSVKSCTHPYLRTCVCTHLYLQRNNNVYKHDKTYSSTCVTWWFMYDSYLSPDSLIKSFFCTIGLFHTKHHWYMIHGPDTLRVC